MKICYRCQLEKEQDCFAFVNGKQLSTCRKCRIEIRYNSNARNKRKYVSRLLKERQTDKFAAMRNHYRIIPSIFLECGYNLYVKLVGLEHSEFRKKIEDQFEPWMTWENRQSTKGGVSKPFHNWTLDHIVPISTATNEEELKQLTNWTNLKPVCTFINNRIKRHNPRWNELDWWLEQGYRTEVGQSIKCYYKDDLIHSIDLESLKDQDILDVFIKHRTYEYMRQIS